MVRSLPVSKANRRPCPVQQAPATPLAIPTVPLAASPPGLSNASSHSWTKVGSDPYGKDGSVPAGAVDDAATGDGWPCDDGDGGNDKDKKKKKKKKKKDRSRRRRRDPSSSPSSSSSSTSTASDESSRRKLLKHLGNSSDPTAERVRVKEGDRIQIPRFPKPEQHRNWRIKVRDAVVATSDQPEKAFEWIEATWIPGQTVEVLRVSGMFVHLDAKLASALTNILEGDLARQVDIFKEQEAKEKRYARGRQILLMVHKHFSTNIKHGAIYDFEDLLSVQLINEDLKNFMTRWDTVIAGMGNEQNEKNFEALFHRQIRKFRPLSHDLNEYERAEEGTEKHSYKFLIDASRNYLERKRLVHMRDAMSSNTTGRGRTPSNNPAVPGVPKGVCVKFQTGQCTYGSDCRFEHVKAPKGKGKGKKGGSRPQTPRKYRSQSPPGSKPQVCKFFKANRCERGKDCLWQHPATSKAAPAPKAEKTASGDTPKTSPREKKKKKGSRPSSQDSKDSKGSQSLKFPRSSKGSNAAVCLLQAMVCAATLDSVASHPCLPSVTHDVFQSMPCVKKCVQFSDYPFIWNYDTDGDLWPYTASSRRCAHEFPVDYVPKFDERAVSDATLIGTMHEAMMKDLLKGTKTPCKFQCDSDFGCDSCIPAGLTAEPEKPVTSPKRGKAAVARMTMDSSHIPWIADTGASQDLLSGTDAEMGCIYESSQPLKISTANGNIIGTKQARVKIQQTDSVVRPYVLDKAPSVLSVGMRCLRDGYDFVWRAHSRPYFRLPDGSRIKLEVKDNVPCIPPATQNAVPALSQSIPKVTSLPSAPIEIDDEVLVIDEEPEAVEEVLVTNEDDGDELGNDDFLLEDAISQPEGEVIEECHDNSSEDAPKAIASDFVSKPIMKDAPRERGEAALRDEATSLQHLMCHSPKNPFCETCNRAKMYKYPSRQKGGSTQVEAKKFGDHLTADHLITSDDREIGIDQSRVALVVRDVATDFRYVYPAARKTSHHCVMAFKHFVRTGETVNVFYSDRAPELVKAADQLEWKHVQSTNYISKTNAIAERNVRAIIEGTRTNLEQAGLHHSYWPHAAKHYCMAHNITDHPDYYSPWKVRFGEDFPGPYLPFGCQVNFWTGPRNRPNKPLKFEPTSRAGIFLGYPIHPDFLWRHEFLVIPLRDLMEKDYDQPIAPLRVNQIKCPDGEFSFPMVERHLLHMNGVMPGLEYAPETPDPAALDAPLLEEDLPAEMPGQDEIDDQELAENLGKLIKDSPEKGPASEEMVKVIDLKTSKDTFAPKDGGAHYDAGGVKARRYSGSSKPDSIPPFLWKTMSTKQRRLAIIKDEREKARKALLDEPVSEDPEASSSKARPATTAGLEDEFSNIPLMPVAPCVGDHSKEETVEDALDVVVLPALSANPELGQHRCKVLQAHLHPVIHAMVARPVGRKEIESNADAQKSIDVEWHNLESKGAWDYNTVREWSQVVKEAKGRSEKVHVGKIFEICVEKGSELQKGNPLRKFKGRTVFQGNNVKDENAEQALFAELGSAPSTMEAAKAIDAYGAMPGNCTQQSDGRQAYTQALYKGIKTWVRLPKYRWPKGWASKYSDPVAQLILALYGHPDSGGLWEKHCEDILLSLGFRLVYPGAWPSVFWHPKLRLLLAVYVDDFKMSGPVQNVAKGWELISSKIDMDPPSAVGRYLGCEHVVTEKVQLSPEHHPFAHVFKIMTWRIHPTRMQPQLAELRITGNTIQNMAWLFVNTSSQGANFAARLTLLPKRLGWAGRGTQSVVHVLIKMVLLSSIGISMKTMIRCRMFLFFGLGPRISFMKTLEMPA